MQGTGCLPFGSLEARLGEQCALPKIRAAVDPIILAIHTAPNRSTLGG
jgi:hypothetical protein